MKILKDIETIVGSKGLILGEDVFNRKAGIWIDDGIRADAIVRPKDTQELSEVLEFRQVFLWKEPNKKQRSMT